MTRATGMHAKGWTGLSIRQIRQSLRDQGFIVNEVTPFGKGTNAGKYVVMLGGKRHILRVYGQRKAKRVAEIIRFLERVNREGQITVISAHQRVLRFPGAVGFMYEYIRGKIYRVAKVRDKWFTFGRVVGRFHRQSASVMPGRTRAPWVLNDLAHFKRMIRYLSSQNVWGARAANILDEALTRAYRSIQGLKIRTPLCHGDLHWENVLFEKKKGRCVIIDVDCLNYDALAYDVGVSISYLLTQSTAENKKRITGFMKGYESEKKLWRKEKRVILPLMLLRKMAEITWVTGERKNGRIEKRFAENLIRYSMKHVRILMRQYDDLEILFKEM